MWAYIKDIQSLLIVLIVAILLFIFRKEVMQIVNWIVSFKRFSKSKDGYEASSEPAGEGISTSQKKEAKETKKIASVDIDRGDTEDKEKSWIPALLQKDYETAHRVLKERMENERDEKQLSHLRGELGFIKFVIKKEDGIKYFEFAISEGRVDPDLFHWYAFSHSWFNNYDEIIRVAKKSIELGAASPSVYGMYAESLVELGKPIDAIELLAGESYGKPDEVSYYAKIAEILVGLNMKALAKECCLIGLSRNPDNETLLIKHAEIAGEMESFKEAMQSYLRLTELKPSNQRYWTFLGNQYLMLDLNDLALKAYRRANQLASEKEAWILENIGNIMKNRGFYAEGVDYLKRALVLNPDSQYGHERLAIALKSSEEQEEERAKIVKEVKGFVRETRTMEALVADVRSSRGDKEASKVENKKFLG